jgi:hypothetical protein
MAKTKTKIRTTQNAIDMPDFDDWNAWDEIAAEAEKLQEAAAFMRGMNPRTSLKEEMDALDAASRPVERANGNGSGHGSRPADMATDKQRSFIRKLRVERDPGFEKVAAVLGKNLTKKVASKMIESLLALPKQEITRRTHAEVFALDRDVPQGTFTIVKKDGTYRTLQIEAAKWCDNKIVASYLCGPDNELSYKGFAFIANNGRVSIWSKFKENSDLVADLTWLLEEGNLVEAHNTFLDNAEQYALRSGRCMRCCRKLTVPASLHRGLGPVCADKEGI